MVKSRNRFFWVFPLTNHPDGDMITHIRWTQ